MKPTSTPRTDRLAWQDIKDRIDLAAVATGLLGPAPKKSGRRLLWHCPFHDDRDPSLQVDPKTRRWKCWPCDRGGDAPALVMQLEGVAFPEAVRRVAGQAGIVAPSGRPVRAAWPSRPSTTAKAAGGMTDPRRSPGGRFELASAEAGELVEDSAARLWTGAGESALEYLVEHRRLTEATIRRHRLGWVRAASVPNADATRFWQPGGVVIPWFDGGRLSRVKIRQPDGRRPRYAEVYSQRPGIFPGREAIRRDVPLIAVEGEFDAMLLAEELGELAGVFTAGGASSPIHRSTGMAMLCHAHALFAAHDADEAGDRAAAAWSASATRVRPPAGKDWTDARLAGIDLRSWWIEQHFPEAFDREERAAIMEFDEGLSRDEAERAARRASP